MDTKPWPHSSRLRSAVLCSALALATVGLAACGSGGDPPAAGAGAQGGQNGRPQIGSDQQAAFKKFRDCMRSHSVNLPDFSKGGPPSGGGPPAGVDPSSSTFQRAIQACRQYAPSMGGGGGPPGPAGPPG